MAQHEVEYLEVDARTFSFVPTLTRQLRLPCSGSNHPFESIGCSAQFCTVRESSVASRSQQQAATIHQFSKHKSARGSDAPVAIRNGCVLIAAQQRASLPATFDAGQESAAFGQERHADAALGKLTERRHTDGRGAEAHDAPDVVHWHAQLLFAVHPHDQVLVIASKECARGYDVESIWLLSGHQSV
jgi:hypothetical protein